MYGKRTHGPESSATTSSERFIIGLQTIRQLDEIYRPSVYFHLIKSIFAQESHSRDI